MVTTPASETTRSSILLPRQHDTYGDKYGFNEWPFLSVHFWGEGASGNWTLEVDTSSSHGSRGPNSKGGVLKKWQLVFYGTYSLPKQAEDMYLVHRKVPPPTTSSPNPIHSDASTDKDYSYVTDSGHAVAPKCDINLKNSTCQCPGSNLYLGANNQCHPCAKSCKTCYGPGPKHCLSCSQTSGKTYYLREMSQCFDSCPDGYMASQNENECQKCPPFCQTCLKGPSAGVQCAKCEGSLVIHEGKCLTTCPYGYFKSQESGSCQKCNTMCETCVGPRPSQCSKCTKGHSYYQRQDITTCICLFPDYRSVLSK